MKALVGALEKAQYSGKIVVWQAKEKEDPAKLDAAEQLYDGGFGHAPYVSGFGKNGYGPMQYTTILAVIAWQGAGQCGVNANPDRIKRALDFIQRGTNAAGYVAYGGEFTLNNGFVDPVAWKKSTGGDDYVGRSGASYVAHKLSPEFTESAEYMDKNRSYLKKAYKSLPDGHADANLGIIWGLLGAGAAEDDALLRKMLDYHKAFFNMMRCYDGSFVLLPGRNYADDGYYMASRYHPTATMALVLGLSNPKLLVQGIQVRIPGVNPKAYRAIVRKAYGEAASALKNAAAQDSAVAVAMTTFLDAQSQRAVAKLEALEKTGDIAQLEAELSKTRSSFGLLNSFKEKTARYEEGLRQDPWKTELKTGAYYQQLVGALKRNKSAAYAGDLEKFAEKHPDSLYAKWAQEVAKEFRSSGSIKDPSISIVSSADNSTDTAARTFSPAPTPVTAQTPAKPVETVSPAASKPPATSAGVPREILAEYQIRFIRKLDELLANGAKLDVWLSNWGPKPVRFGLRKVSEAGLVVQQNESLLPVPWHFLAPEDRAALAKSLVKEDDVEAMLIAAVLLRAAGKTDDSETLLALAGRRDAEAAKKTRNALVQR